MKSNNYIQIQGWMITDLKLNGNNLLAYALIYGFSQDGQSEFTGSIKYVCKWLGCSRNTAIKVLKELTEKNLIEKNQVEVNSVTFNKYSANLTSAGTFSKGSAETAPPVQKKDGGSAEIGRGGSAETAPNNTIINNTKYNDDDVYKNIDILLEDYLKEERLVKAVIDNPKNKFKGKEDLEKRLKEFNEHLEQVGKFQKTWSDYTTHFRNWHLSNKKQKSNQGPTDKIAIL